MTNTKRKNNKKGINIHQGNVFALGGDLFGSILGGVTSLAGSALSNLQVPETHNQLIMANNNEDLMAQMSAYKPTEITKANVGGSALSGAASGASAGMAFGPWGAAVGGLIGGLSGGISSALGNNKKKALENTLKTQLVGNFQAVADNIQGANTMQQMANYSANGGELTTFENGGTHELNPNGGVPQGVDDNGTPNLVEQGESKYKNYIFSDRLKYDKKNTFSDMAKKFSKESNERPNDSISKRGLESNLGKLRQSLDMFKELNNMQDSKNTFVKGGGMLMANANKLFNPFQTVQDTPFSMVPQNNTIVAPTVVTPNRNKRKKIVTPTIFKSLDMNNPTLGSTLSLKLPINKVNLPVVSPAKITPNKLPYLNRVPALEYIPTQTQDWSTMLRYAPALASGVASITDALGVTNTPDYTAANELNSLGVKGERIGNYLGYTPLDLNYFANQLGANAAATREGLKTASGGNRATYMAGLLGADASYNEGLGKLARQATESNMAQRQLVEGFNRGTNQFNAQLSNWEQGINMQNKATAIGLREQARLNATNAKMTNLNNFVDSLGGIGQENMYRNMIQNNPALAYKLGILGNIDFKNGESKKNGGKLKTKTINYGW